LNFVIIKKKEENLIQKFYTDQLNNLKNKEPAVSANVDIEDNSGNENNKNN